MWVPELLAPAGSMEKLKVAISYGANAVYLGGQNFGLRSAADNFSPEEIVEAVQFAHKKNSKVYVVLNSFLHDKDLLDLPNFLKILEKAKVDAVICSDLGVVKCVAMHSQLVIHLSTQASCLNSYSAKAWKQFGVKRIVLGREVSIQEARKIKEVSGLEVELFVHGSMCMAYSGNCVISNYTQGRDSNRGGCAHSCRFEYSFDESDKKKNSFFMSSKDLEGIRVLKDFIDAGIDSLKVEGRMKSHHYAGTVSKVYSQALNYYKEHGNFLSDDIEKWACELRKISHRDYTEASLISPADENSIFDKREHNESETQVAGIVIDVLPESYTLVEVRSSFKVNEILEFVPFGSENFSYKIDQISDVSGELFEKSKPGMIVKFPYIKDIERFNIVRSLGNN